MEKIAIYTEESFNRRKRLNELWGAEKSQFKNYIVVKDLLKFVELLLNRDPHTEFDYLSADTAHCFIYKKEVLVDLATKHVWQVVEHTEHFCLPDVQEREVQE